MAKITFGQGIADARGAVGGQVFSRNKGGAYLRARIAPINRNTPQQTAVRANFGANAKGWGTLLTAAQRTAWTNFAAANPRVNILGASIILAGLAMFQSLNQVLAQILSTLITDPPPDLSVPIIATVTAASADSATPDIKITTDAQATVADAAYYIFATKPLAPGKTPQTSDFRFIGNYAPTPAATHTSFAAAYQTLFGAWNVGASIGVQVATVNTASGALTPGLRFNVIST